MHVVDIIQDPLPRYLALLEREQKNIVAADVRLSKNYVSMNLDDFYSFTLLLSDDDRLVAFSGLQKPGPWSPNVARISSRFRIANDFQTIGLMGRSYDRSIFSGSKYLIPYQLGVAIDLNLSGVFCSRENLTKRKHLQSMADRFNEFETRTRYEVYPKAVNVCRRLGDGKLNIQNACWQNAIVAKLQDDFELGLPEKDIPDV